MEVTTMTLLTKADQTKKNKLIRKANTLGWKIDFWGFVEWYAKEIKNYSAAKISKCQDKQDKLLDEIDEIRKGGVELIEAVNDKTN
jgi:hypothetical protein